MYHVDEKIELNLTESEDIKGRSYFHSHIRKKPVSIEIDHAALKSLNQKIEM